MNTTEAQLPKMPNILTTKVVILWEHELIAAAKSLAPFAPGGNPTEKDAENMVKACFSALYSPELASGDVPVTIMHCKETVMVTKTEVKP